MQLSPGRSQDDPSGRRRRSKRIATSLVAATASLLGSQAPPSIAAESSGRYSEKWRFDTDLAYYGESERVTDVSTHVLARRFLERGRLAMRLAVDVLTGSSANGAIASRTPQTFTTPSGNGSYDAATGDTPLDATFRDTRIALAGNWQREIGRRGEIDLGLSLSNEYDYFHTGANARYTRDLDHRNTSLSFGVAFASDGLDPVGGAPRPFAEMLPEGAEGNKLGTESKTVLDVLVGVTQVFGKRTIAQLNYAASLSSGYLNDPYKVVSVVDPVTGDLVDRETGRPYVGAPGSLALYRFESRPDARAKHSLFGQVKHRFGRHVFDGAYRFMTDDWGIVSHTVDFRWRHAIGQGWYLQPHLRYYDQRAADFYVPYLLDGDPLPEDASADYRLGDLSTYTVGLKLGRPLGGEREASVRVEYYEQSVRGPPGAAFGSLRGLDLFPSVDAVIVQIGYRF